MERAVRKDDLAVLLIPGFYDLVLRDFGLLLAALTLFRLASVYDARPLPR